MREGSRVRFPVWSLVLSSKFIGLSCERNNERDRLRWFVLFVRLCLPYHQRQRLRLQIAKARKQAWGHSKMRALKTTFLFCIVFERWARSKAAWMYSCPQSRVASTGGNDVWCQLAHQCCKSCKRKSQSRFSVRRVAERLQNVKV